jgi:dihydroflavonol-4-reductase
MRVFLTGATGLLGSNLARLLQERGDQAVCLVRRPEKATALRGLGCKLISGSLAERPVMEEAVAECEAVIHAAALFEVGLPEGRRREMVATNIQGTRHVLEAAEKAGVERLIYVSTVAALGNTRGAVADESTPHPGDYASHYEWTKVQAHRIVRRWIDERALPGMIVLPSTIYGPEDRSQLGAIMRRFLDGQAPLMLFPDTTGFSLVHVADVAAGILLALDRGQIGQEYILGGEITTMRAFVRRVAELAGMRVPEAAVPAFVLRHMLPPLRPVARRLGFPPNVREGIAGLDGFTYWASHEKATRELGYRPRPLLEGLRETLEVEGRLPKTGEPAAAPPKTPGPNPIAPRPANPSSPLRASAAAK